MQPNKSDDVQINLKHVPKILKLLKEIHPEGKLISFKLETDEDELYPKIASSFEKYDVDMVLKYQTIR
jgi:DNA / pantothenate metabolism flavoprotein